MQRTLALADLRGENAFTILATMRRLLKQIDRELGSSLEDEYAERAIKGDYAHLCAVTEEYALAYAASTLNAREGDLTDAVTRECEGCGERQDECDC